MTRWAALASTARRRVSWLVRDRLPERRVVREVQGVRLALPWSHRLPDYAAANPAYGQNLVELAALLAKEEPLTLLDIGANVGDSTLQILHAAGGRALCVEGDPGYLTYLHLNVDGDDRVDVVEALLTVDEIGEATTAVRSGGTTRFVRGETAGDAMPSVSATELRGAFPAFDRLRLVKSDTDGYDVLLVPAVAEAWSDSPPVLFFEYDPYLIRLAGLDPAAVWPTLEQLGYVDVAVWDHGGTPMGRFQPGELGARSAELDQIPGDRPAARSYWDVALAHRDDAAGRAALASLIPTTR
ncbi:hypothetical protein [Nocardioides sp. Kera G14]|uniref:hypothetical protein n=1 Tax=Nocardioides sp. Kera G14 TaxID=2884264 RepID=UPI001D125469|nr:hypothetical protein [Nocardioides sp. Kera G14]UDY23622.1 hypothetical protein LH076_16415 [Nocardioides sp. Kera G14]